MRPIAAPFDSMLDMSTSTRYQGAEWALSGQLVKPGIRTESRNRHIQLFGNMKQTTTITVRSYECDMYGHVNHAVYVNYLEHARIDFLHAHGFDYEGMVAAGFFMVVMRLHLTYRLPAHTGDELQIETQPREVKRVSGVIHQVIQRGQQIVAEAEVTWCVVDARGQPVRPPAAYDLRRFSPPPPPQENHAPTA